MRETPIHDDLKHIFDEVTQNSRTIARLELQTELIKWANAELNNTKNLGVMKMLAKLKDKLTEC